MRKKLAKILTNPLHILLLFCLSFSVNAQDVQKSKFWNQVQFGGGFGLGVGSGFTNISVAPSAIYNFNDFVALGIGLQYTHLKQKDFYRSNTYGASCIGLFNPLDYIQISMEVEQLRVNLDHQAYQYKDSFWNTGLFLGLGYRAENITIGARYNLLNKNDQGVYGDALMPFVRLYF